MQVFDTSEPIVVTKPKDPRRIAMEQKREDERHVSRKEIIGEYLDEQGEKKGNVAVGNSNLREI